MENRSSRVRSRQSAKRVRTVASLQLEARKRISSSQQRNRSTSACGTSVLPLSRKSSSGTPSTSSHRVPLLSVRNPDLRNEIIAESGNSSNDVARKCRATNHTPRESNKNSANAFSDPRAMPTVPNTRSRVRQSTSNVPIAQQVSEEVPVTTQRTRQNRRVIMESNNPPTQPSEALLQGTVFSPIRTRAQRAAAASSRNLEKNTPTTAKTNTTRNAPKPDASTSVLTTGHFAATNSNAVTLNSDRAVKPLATQIPRPLRTTGGAALGRTNHATTQQSQKALSGRNQSVNSQPGKCTSSSTTTNALVPDDTRCCCICLDQESELLDNDRHIMSMRCGHILCNVCWEKLTQRYSRCPVCRTNLFEGGTQNSSDDDLSDIFTSTSEDSDDDDDDSSSLDSELDNHLEYLLMFTMPFI